MEKVKERRSSERISAVFPITVTEWSSFSPLMEGETVNISERGACLITNKPIPVGHQIHLQIEVPSDYSFVSIEKGNLEVDAHVLWISSEGQFQLYRCGVIFLNTSDTQICALRNIIRHERDKLSKRDWEISHPKISLLTLPLTHELFVGISPSALSVDVTNLCNLRCKHCYWNSYKSYLTEGTNKNILDSAKAILDKFPSITNITWYGGEPLINQKTISIVEEGLTLKKNNLVITNGTMPIPDWHNNVHIGVSLDGTREIHNKIRNHNIYDKIRNNVLQAAERDIPIAILYCINALNFDCIPDFLEEWSKINLIGIAFTTYVPLRDKPNLLGLSDAQRDKTVSILMKMKKKYGRFIGNSELMIELLRAKYGEELAVNCPMNVYNIKNKVYCLHMCNDGTIRIPCAIGQGADHIHCRSVTKVALYAGKVLHDRESYIALLRMYLSGTHNRKEHLIFSMGT